MHMKKEWTVENETTKTTKILVPQLRPKKTKPNTNTNIPPSRRKRKEPVATERGSSLWN